jgi:hypothetical protein
VTDVIIKAVETMAEAQGVKSLKLQNRRKTIFYPTDWIAGVEYDDENVNNDNNDNDEDDNDDNDDEDNENENDNDDNEDAEVEDEEAYDRIDQQDIDELVAEPKDNANPTGMNEHEDEAEDEEEIDEEDDDEPPELIRRQPARTRQAPERLTYAQSEVKTKKNVKFTDDNNVDEYNPQHAMLIARYMVDINAKASAQGASFGQQYILQKGLKKFKQAGEQAASKELD